MKKPDYIPEPLRYEPEPSLRGEQNNGHWFRRLDKFLYKTANLIAYVFMAAMVVFWLVVGVRWVTNTHVHTPKIDAQGKELVIYADGLLFSLHEEEYKTFPVDMRVCSKCGAVFMYIDDDMRSETDAEPLGK